MARKNATEEEKRAAADYQREWDRRRIERLLADPSTLLCACGCGEPVVSANRNAKYARGHWTLGREFQSTEKASVAASIRDIYWAAGFLEGEGYFSSTQGSNGYPVTRVTVSQQQREPLERLQRHFGGTIKERPAYRTTKPYFRWYVHQVRARGVMMTLYSLMSPRRKEQIKDVLSKWNRNGHSTTWDRRRAKMKNE